MASTPDKRLFGRIVVLTFLFGLVSGLWGALMGVSLYKSTRWVSGLLIPYPFGWPLDALQTTLGGAIMVLLVTVPDLYKQFTRGSSGKTNRRVFVHSGDRFLRITGFCVMGEGIVSLLEKPLSILYPRQEQGIILFLILLVPLCVGVLSWYIFVRGKRRSQQLKEEAVSPMVRGDEESQRDLEGAD